MKTKRRLVIALTWFVVLWPCAQLALVQFASTNPWRLMGFAMYATEHDIQVTLRREGAVVAPSDLPPAVRLAYDDFVSKRTILGRLYSPAAFVGVWRRADPSVGPVDIDIEVRRLKRARMTTVARDHLSF